jgi:hypothetical protein
MARMTRSEIEAIIAAAKPGWRIVDDPDPFGNGEVVLPADRSPDLYELRVSMLGREEADRLAIRDAAAAAAAPHDDDEVEVVVITPASGGPLGPRTVILQGGRIIAEQG